ncbi:twin-arginine translocation signal domain-containing protein [Halomarina oriensis]|uniref:Fe2+ transport protein n=1 Tax=Halomarina oriensis TaxID=671145 RepID=A0A6B0GLV2_9EURY|nr:twin-arginine translocation signal domain-containing protein [Halomarina oriensis]MWG35856.1 fe2+ transport protein [Halomarina oriensis]
MRRRRFLRGAIATTGALALAGCSESQADENGTTGIDSGTTDGAPAANGTADADAPDGIYVQSFAESMSMQGMATSGDYQFGLMFTVPHTFWNVNGSSVEETSRTDDDSLHLMASVWDPETKTVLPETGLSVELRREEELVSQEVIYPMLSQPMGFHYGGNFSLPGNGEYTATLSVGGLSTRRTGTFEGRFGDPANVEIPLSFTEETQREVGSQPIEKAGDRGALAPMQMGMLPQSVLPTPDEMPGALLGTPRSDDADFVTLALDAPPAGVDGDGYLAVSARTRYNRLVLPAMGLEATVTRGDETVFDGSLERTLDPDLGYHYGAGVAVESGDEVTLSVSTPPQVARHEGYERAFLQFEPMELTVE